MKKIDSGITLVSLVITMIVLLILTSITIYSGVSTIHSARLTKFTTQLKIMQQKVNELYDCYTNNKTVILNGIEYVGKGETITETINGEIQTVQSKPGIQEIGQDIDAFFSSSQLKEIFSEAGSGITDKTGYRYYDTETIQALGLEDMEYEFFVNVEKRSIVSMVGFNDYGSVYYTLEQVPNGVYNVEYNLIDGNLSFDVTSEIQKGQGKIYIVNIHYNNYVNKWKIRYRLKAEEDKEENLWYTTEEFTGNEYTIDVPTNHLLDTYEIQVIHGDEEIASEIKEHNILTVGAYINYDPTIGENQEKINDVYVENGVAYSYESSQGTYHENQAEAVEDTNSNMEKGNGYEPQRFSVEANTNGWKVLGIDEGTDEILLISTNIVKTIDNEYFYLRGQTGYEWGATELNDICAIYGKGKGATGARSITVEDINKITGYNPDTEKCYEGNLYEYGNKVTYTKNPNNISYQDSMENVEPGVYGNASTMFRYFDEGSRIWKTLTTEPNKNTITLRSTAYYYSSILPTSSNGEISIDSTEYEILFSKTENEQKYWLASTYAYTDNSYVAMGLRCVFNGGVSVSNGLVGSYGTPDNVSYGVRPIVSLKSNISISGGDGTSANTAYQIQ